MELLVVIGLLVVVTTHFMKVSYQNRNEYITRYHPVEMSFDQLQKIYFTTPGKWRICNILGKTQYSYLTDNNEQVFLLMSFKDKVLTKNFIKSLNKQKHNQVSLERQQLMLEDMRAYIERDAQASKEEYQKGLEDYGKYTLEAMKAIRLQLTNEVD